MTAPPARLVLQLIDNRELRQTAEFDGPVVVGRQESTAEGLFSRRRLADAWRWVVAGSHEVQVSRAQARLEALGGGRVRVSNQHPNLPLRFPNQPDLPAGGHRDIAAPAEVLLGGGKILRVRLPDALQSLSGGPPPPGTVRAAASRLPILAAAGDHVAVGEVIDWLNHVLDVLQAATTSADFFACSARAVAETAGLSSGRVLLLEGGEWAVKACHVVGTAAASVRPPSQTVLEHVREKGVTTWELPESAESVQGVAAVVAAPLLDKSGAVIGAVYGDRLLDAAALLRAQADAGITRLQARLVELIACGVAAGLARQAEEQKALAAAVRFEQFFADDLTRQLLANPALLAPREAEQVTVLFCDMRGFTRISQRLGIGRVDAFCRQVLDALSECVLAEGGVLVDFVGDGLLAMWGAPTEQPDHAARACRAALAMLGCLPAINAAWQDAAGEPLALGLGIHTGAAQVGDIGSTRKFKYGPRGPMVNLGSRVEGATKHFLCSALLTAATRERLGDGFATRRLGRVLLHNVNDPVELHELMPPDACDWPRPREAYEEALVHFEEGRFAEAVQALATWGVACPQDMPARRLLQRAVGCMAERPAEHPVWVLRGK